MKTIKLLTILAVCSLFTGNLLAQCSTGLDDSLSPSGTAYLEGETIEYQATLAIANPDNCDITNIEVYFFSPDNLPNAANPCDATNGIKVYDGGALVLGFGDPAIVIDSSNVGSESMSYIVDQADADTNGFLYAYICTKFETITNLGNLPASDNKPSINAIISPDFMVDKACVNPDGTLTGEDVDFQITITNTGNVALTFFDTGTELDAYEPIVVPPLSAAPANVFQATVTKPSTGECDDDQIVSNEVEVDAYYNGQLIGTKSDSADCPVLCPPSFTVDKICLTDPITNEPNALFEIIITNTGYVTLTFEIDDEAAGIEDMMTDPVAPGGTYQTTVAVPVECINGGVSNRVIVQAYFDGSPVLDPMPKDAVCPCAQEGCTPGFWKNHPDCWDCFEPTDTLNTVFAFPSGLTSLGDYTLMQGLKFKGGAMVTGAAQILLRAAVAAVLNACDEDVNYPLSTDDVIDQVNAALATTNRIQILNLATTLDMYNNYGCPIDAHCNRMNDDVNGD